MNNTWCCIAVCVFFCMVSSAFAASGQEADFALAALEQLRDRMEQDDKGTLDEFVADVSTASGLSAAVSRDSLVSLLRDLKTHCKKSTALGEQLFALHGEHFSEREAKAYLVRVVDMAGDLLKKEENVGLEPLIAKAASKSKLLKFQALDYTAALLVSFVGLPVAEELVEDEGAVNAPTGPFKVLVRTSNSEGLSGQVDRLVENGSSSNASFFRVFKVSARPKMKAKRKILALHESVRPALLDELIKRFDRVRVTTNPSAKDIRYTLDYIVHAYWVGIYGGNTDRHALESYVLLVVKDMLKGETVLEQELNIRRDFMPELVPEDESILEDFYQEAARTVAQEVSPLFD
ncbi:MAG: hypothetical protein F4Z85_02355 [Gemmatimonadetes bacterium]|nr:hypothetical protein [Gemmatimonadota bacterium]MYB68464.1 hypothetical protein [Gemmatimonadota bacterium]